MPGCAYGGQRTLGGVSVFPPLWASLGLNSDLQICQHEALTCRAIFPPPHRPPELVKCMSFSFLAKQQNGLLCEIIQ